MLDSVGESTYTYDERNWLETETRNNNSIWDNPFTTHYKYNDVGDLIAIGYPSGETVTYTVDTLHRTNSVKLATGDLGLATYSYNPMGTIKQIDYGNGIRGDYKYEVRDRMKKLLYDKGEGTDLLFKHKYKYDKVGNRTQLIESDVVSGTYGKKTEYLYDNLYRLKMVHHRERNQSFSYYWYDKSGNRTKFECDQGEFVYKMEKEGEKQISNKLKEIISNEIGHTYCDYDNNGNLIEEKDYRGSQTTGELLSTKNYTWDFEGRLMKVSHLPSANNPNTKTVEFAYDGDSKRVAKKVMSEKEGVETVKSFILYVRNAMGEVIEEYIPDDLQTPTTWNVESVYIFGNGKRIVKIDDAGNKIYYQSDILGSSCILTNESGDILELTKYDEFGNVYFESSTHNSELATHNSYKYTGKPFDEEIGLYYYGARYYNAKIGRWISKDIKHFRNNLIEPLTSQNLNYYIYCNNNPLIYNDPTGRWKYPANADKFINMAKTFIGITYGKEYKKGQLDCSRLIFAALTESYKKHKILTRLFFNWNEMITKMNKKGVSTCILASAKKGYYALSVVKKKSDIQRGDLILSAGHVEIVSEVGTGKNKGKIRTVAASSEAKGVIERGFFDPWTKGSWWREKYPAGPTIVRITEENIEVEDLPRNVILSFEQAWYKFLKEKNKEKNK
jgi:RHS repeat-associated protein